MKKITSLEYNTLLWFLTRATFIEITAEILLNNAHQDSWISILIAIIIGILPFLLYSYLKNKYPSVAEIQAIDSKEHSCDEIALQFARLFIKRLKAED